MTQPIPSPRDIDTTVTGFGANHEAPGANASVPTPWAR
jgi:hypothetical protein